MSSVKSEKMYEEKAEKMMSDGVKFTMSVMINKDKTKVLFAEIDNDLADVLLSFFTLPLGTIVRLLNKQYENHVPVFGSLNTLYNGLENMDNVHFGTKEGKQMLLRSRNSLHDECSKLKLNIDDTPNARYFYCGCIHPAHHQYDISFYQGVARSQCGKLMDIEIEEKSLSFELNTQADNSVRARGRPRGGAQKPAIILNPVRAEPVPWGTTYVEENRRGRPVKIAGAQPVAVNDDGVFTKKTVSFLITDDLCLLPNVTSSIIQTLTSLGITDTSGAEQKTVSVGFKEIMALLRGSLFSKTPLTDLILRKRQMNNFPTPELELLTTFYHSGSPKKMVLKAMVQKSTKKFLFAQANADFVELLFSFLTIPLGEVECLLESNTSLGSIDNLYKSISKMKDDKFKTPDTKHLLLKPKLPPKYLSNNLIFPLGEHKTPERFNRQGPTLYAAKSYRVNFEDPKGEGSYVKEGAGMYLVTDDLTVKPLQLVSSLATLNELNIPISDIEELELQIGFEEGLSILKASLTSTSVLTNLLNSTLMNQDQPKQPKRPKQEHSCC